VIRVDDGKRGSRPTVEPLSRGKATGGKLVHLRRVRVVGGVEVGVQLRGLVSGGVVERRQLGVSGCPGVGAGVVFVFVDVAVAVAAVVAVAVLVDVIAVVVVAVVVVGVFVLRGGVSRTASHPSPLRHSARAEWLERRKGWLQTERRLPPPECLMGGVMERGRLRWRLGGGVGVACFFPPYPPPSSGTPRGRSGWSGGRAGSRRSGAFPLRSA